MSLNATDELLPCPFCGGEAEIHPSDDWDVSLTGATYFAWCDKCETRGDYYNTEAEATAAWNTRSITAAAVYGYQAAQGTCRIVKKKFPYSEVPMCSECGRYWLEDSDNFCSGCGRRVVA